MDTIGFQGGEGSQAAGLDGRREANGLRAGAFAWGSVSQVARRYDVNANLVFTWLRDPRYAPGESAEGFLPVEIVEDHEWRHPATGAEGRIEIDLAGGHSLRVTGSYDPEDLARLIRD